MAPHNDKPPKVPMFGVIAKMFGVTAKTGTKSLCLAEALSSVAEGFMCALKSPGPAPLGISSPTPNAISYTTPGIGGVSGKVCSTLYPVYLAIEGTSSATETCYN